MNNTGSRAELSPPNGSFQAAQPFHLLLKPTGARCNLACSYCFFLSKESLYPASTFRMSDELLEDYLRQLFAAQPYPEVNICWQGGEPTLMGLSFFQRSVRYAEKYKKVGQKISYTFQTNGTKINDEWAAFFKQHNFLVGLSIDGPAEMHDRYRVNKNGSGTFNQVMKSWQILERHKVDVNILCTLHAANADYPSEVYHFFRDQLNAQYIQFIPIVERATPESLPVADQGWGSRPGNARPLYTQSGNLVTERSVQPEQFGRFLTTVFDEWVRKDVGRIFVQSFDAALSSLLGQPSLCIFQPTCGANLVLEHNGDLYTCDHYVEPGYLLGNIRNTPLADLVNSGQLRQFGQAKLATLPQYCQDCDVLFACFGECPRNRFTLSPDGEPGLNYLCAGYKRFFHHTERPMRLMKDLLRHGHFADEVMGMLD